MMRDDDGVLTPEREEKIKKEMGDTLFYMAILATKLGFNFSDAAHAELDKLQQLIYDWEKATGKTFSPETFKHDKRNSK